MAKQGIKPGRKSPPEVYIILLIFFTAYVIRLAYIIEISEQPYFTAPAVDAQYHDEWAMDIAGGKLFYGEPFFRAPLYPYLLGGIYHIFGHDYFITRIIQALIGALSCVLIYFLGKKIFSKRVGTISAFAAAGAWMLVYFEGELLLPVILVPLDLGLLLSLMRATETDDKRFWALSGSLFGLSMIARPNIGIILPLLIYLFFKKTDIKSGINRAIMFVIPAIMPILPVTIHNIKAGDFVPIATQGGVNFYIGNNPDSEGSAAVFPGLGNIWRYEDAVGQAESAVGRELKPSEVSDFYYKKGFQYILGQPLDWLKLMGRKIMLLFNAIEISNNKNIYFAAQDSRILTSSRSIGFWLYAPLGILGFLIFYKRSINDKLIVWFVILYSLSIILFFVTARYRVPLIPLLIIFGVGAVDWIIDRFRLKEFKALIVPCIILMFLFVLVDINWPNLQKIAYDYAHFSLGNAYQKKGELQLAKQEYLKALEYNQRYLQVHLNLGVIYYDMGDYSAAEKEFWKEIQINKGFEAAYAFNNIGNIRYHEGKLYEALTLYKEAMRIYPNYKDGRYNLAKTYNDLGTLKVAQDSLDLSKDYFAKVIEYSPNEPTHYYNYAMVLGELGLETEAVAQLQEALKINPEFEPALKALEVLKQRNTRK